MSILVKPIVTEKLTRLGEKGKQRQYAFVVELDANKIMIKQAIERLYAVQVDTIRTNIHPARVRLRSTKTGVLKGKSGRYKKAYVTLALGQEIDFYKNV